MQLFSALFFSNHFGVPPLLVFGQCDCVLFVGEDVQSIVVQAALLETDPVQVELTIAQPLRSLRDTLKVLGSLAPLKALRASS